MLRADGKEIALIVQPIVSTGHKEQNIRMAGIEDIAGTLKICRPAVVITACPRKENNFMLNNTVNVFSAYSIGGFGRFSSQVGQNNNA